MEELGGGVVREECGLDSTEWAVEEVGRLGGRSEKGNKSSVLPFLDDFFLCKQIKKEKESHNK